MHFTHALWLKAVVLDFQLIAAISFLLPQQRSSRCIQPKPQRKECWAETIVTMTAKNKSEENLSPQNTGSSYDSSGSVTKNTVTLLTSLINTVADISRPLTPQGQQSPSAQLPQSKLLAESTTPGNTFLAPPPQNPAELLKRISDDYTINNYLWTGNIDLSCFRPDCRFTDPTLSFVGVENYVNNVKNLVPIVDFLLGEERKEQSGKNAACRSELLDIECFEEKGYIQTRWNMVGQLNTLPWKPKIDVIGRTKFWYQQVDENADNTSLQVYFYDEMWEVFAGKALLQLITPAGTIKNSDMAADNDVKL